MTRPARHPGREAFSSLLRRASAVALALLLAACANGPFWGEKKKAQAEPEQVLIPMYELDIDAPADLRRFLSRYLDLARFQTSPERDGVSEGELNRLIAAAPAQARGLLETEGYFNAEVKAARLPTPPAPRPADAPPTLPRVKLTVAPGPRTRVASLALDVQGPLRESLQKADPAAIATWSALHRDWLLRPDSEFRQPQWSAAKAAMLDRLRIDGYPGASWNDTEVRIDAAANTAAVDVTADSGPLYRLGRMRIEGLQRHDESSVRNVANFQPGTPYTERLLMDYAERLRKLDLFASSLVELDPEVDDPAAATVVVRVRELPLQQALVGVGASDETGPRLTLEHTHRRVFGRPWVAKNKIEWGRDRQLLDSQLISHPLTNGYRALLAVNVGSEDAEGTLVESSRVRVGRSLDTERTERIAFIEAVNTRTLNAETQGTGETNSRALSANLHWIRRDLDSVLLPTEGTSWNLQGGLGHAWNNVADSGAFGRMYARFTGYRPVGKTWFGSARVEAAQLFAGDQVGIPDTLLFRAGGDDSVRGYAHRSLGPVKSGVVNSGRVLLTGSVEMARPILPSIPTLWGAAFIDAGQAADRWADLRPVWGYGVGVRLRSPVGPLKLDLAYGEATKKVRLHLSIGVTF
jgi:translocation and assembly module TamA